MSTNHLTFCKKYTTILVAVPVLELEVFAIKYCFQAQLKPFYPLSPSSRSSFSLLKGFFPSPFKTSPLELVQQLLSKICSKSYISLSEYIESTGCSRVMNLRSWNVACNVCIVKSYSIVYPQVCIVKIWGCFINGWGLSNTLKGRYQTSYFQIVADFAAVFFSLR